MIVVNFENYGKIKWKGFSFITNKFGYLAYKVEYII